LEWAEHQFKLNKPDQNGTTEREHLEQVEAQTGKRPKALEDPTPFPSLMSHIWSAFCRLNSARSAGFAGPNPISYRDVKDWKELTETPLSAWEVDVIMELDQLYLRTANG